MRIISLTTHYKTVLTKNLNIPKIDQSIMNHVSLLRNLFMLNLTLLTKLKYSKKESSQNMKPNTSNRLKNLIKYRRNLDSSNSVKFQTKKKINCHRSK